MIKIIDDKGKIVPHIMTIIPLCFEEKRTPEDFHRCGHCFKIITIQEHMDHQCPESIRDFYEGRAYEELAKSLLRRIDSFDLKVEIECFMMNKNLPFSVFSNSQPNHE